MMTRSFGNHGRWRQALVAVTLGVAVVSSACLQPSLNPLLLPAGATFDDRLLGTWKSDKTMWTFAKVSDKDVDEMFAGRVYDVAITENAETVKLVAWIGALGAAQFINFFPDESSIEIENSFYRRHMVSMHTFGRIVIADNRVRIGMLDSDWVDNAVKAGSFSLGQSRWPDDAVLLTAPTSDLQRFARAHADDTKAFHEKIELTRTAR